jgi:hypothetical protein
MSDTQTTPVEAIVAAPVLEQVTEAISVIDRAMIIINTDLVSTQSMLTNMGGKAKDISKDSDFVQDWLVPVLENQNRIIAELTRIIMSSHFELTSNIDEIQEAASSPDGVIATIAQYIQQLAIELSAVPPEEINGPNTTVSIPKDNFLRAISILQAIGGIIVSSGYGELLETAEQEPAQEVAQAEEKSAG